MLLKCCCIFVFKMNSSAYLLRRHKTEIRKLIPSNCSLLFSKVMYVLVQDFNVLFCLDWCVGCALKDRNLYCGSSNNHKLVNCSEILSWFGECSKQYKWKTSVAEVMYVQHVLALSCSFLLNNSLSLLAEQRQFISFKLKPAYWKHTNLIWFSYYRLNERGERAFNCLYQNLHSGNSLPWK